MSKTISINDIKYDLLKIIEPYDGKMEARNPVPVRRLFHAYFRDLVQNRMIGEYTVQTTSNEKSFSFDVTIRMQRQTRHTRASAPKHLRIHVGKFEHPKNWKYGDIRWNS